MPENDNDPVRLLVSPDFKVVYANEFHASSTQCDYQLTFMLVTGDEQGVVHVRQAMIIIPHDVRRSLTRLLNKYEAMQGPEDSERVS